MISLLLLIPVLGSLILIPIREDSIKSQSLMKNIALITSLINFLVSIFMWIEFDTSTTQYQFVYEFNQLSFCQFNVGIDGISLYFVLLTTFITPIAILSDYTSITKNIKYFLISFLMLETLQIFAFASLDLLLFYIFFESILPIIFIVIVIYGHGENRFRSAFLLFLYTLAGSLPMLLSILYLYSYIGSTDFQLISLSEISFEIQKLLWLSLSFSKRELTSRIIHKNKHTLNLLERFPRSNRNYLPANKINKYLVIYGTNLESTVNYPKYTTIIRHMVNIPSHLDSIIVGILISDGHMFINKSGNTLLSLKQKVQNFEFLWNVFNIFSHYCQGYPRLETTLINGKIFVAIKFSTRVYPCLTEWYNVFYVNKTKRVPLDLYNMLTYESLAYWIMGDGTKSGKGLTLQTQSFTIKECVFIISILIHKFDLDCSIHMQRNQPTIYIKTRSMEKIKPNLLPYIFPSMRYKLSF